MANVTEEFFKNVFTFGFLAIRGIESLVARRAPLTVVASSVVGHRL